MLLSIALRARFLTTPLTSDEGGYLVVARAWASGRKLYTDTWVDRPQGLLVVFRIWDALTGGSDPAIRVMAMIFGCAAVAAVAYVAFAIAGSRAAALAAVFVAVASANARIEGFIANGELLAGATAATGVAVACAYMFRGRGQSWLFAAGVLSGCAISLKQSGCDGFAAVLVCLLAGVVTRERTWRQVLRESALFVAGTAAVVAVLVAHGAAVGIGAWWYAVAGYRLEGINATSRADWGRFGETAAIAAPTMLPLIGAAAAGIALWLPRRPHHVTRATILIPTWVFCAVATFLAGGLFHRHYWVTLTFPLAVAAAVGVHRSLPRLVLPALATALVLPSVISTMQVVTMDRDEATYVASGDPRSTMNERVAAWYREHDTSSSSIFAMCASAALYSSADSLSPYPFLWQDGVLNGRDAQAKLVGLFAGDDAPTYVVEYQSTQVCNPSGQVDRLLRERYRPLTVVDGRRILVLDPTAVPTPPASPRRL
ncbi:MAG TPA: phospholipid carrier-dependent glycosyltransferase [Ilumatobacteraceae bacterium]